jgi:hypothetical protein
LFLALSFGSPARAAEAPVVYYDATPLFALDLKDEAQRRRFWDESHLLAALQGLANRQAPQLFIRYLREPDDFWWGEMTRPDAWLGDRPVERVATLTALLARFRTVHHGAIVYDERVPATANLASTIAGCDDLLPLRQETRDGSLFRQLTSGPTALPVVTRLFRDDGSPLFTGTGVIPGTAVASTGSAKGDAYVWLIEHYLKTGRANPGRMGYYLDAFWLRCWNAAGPENHTLSNHDFVIARRGILCDLGVWDDEPSVDEPGQRSGADVAVLKRLLRAAWDRTGGEGMIHVAGFVPWAYKYTRHRGAWAAGGTHEEVATEWRYAEILSCFNAYMDADALGLGAMANASFFQHYPLQARYPQPPKPTRQSLIARGVLEPDGRIPRRAFVAHYVGDYDAAAWLYRELPRMWRDPQRGQVPLSWAFNPNLADRFPLGMAWARAHATTNDWFVAGDSGAGYLNPGYLTPPRPHSGLPSGLAAWEKHCREYYERWDLTLTGFVIDGFARGLAPEALAAYARFSPDGLVAQKVPAQGVHGVMPYLRMATDLPGQATEAARCIQSLAAGARPRFAVCRSILQSPSWYARVSTELKALAGDTIQVVDLYTLLWLVREFEAHRADYADKRFAAATEVAATPATETGLIPIYVEDGPVKVGAHDGVPCWRVGGGGRPRYLYFDVDDEFARGAKQGFEIEVTFLPAGSGRPGLEYDSTDVRGQLEGAYTGAAPAAEVAVDGAWRKATWRLENARFAGRQNGGADFRFHTGDTERVIRSVRVRRIRAPRCGSRLAACPAGQSRRNWRGVRTGL